MGHYSRKDQAAIARYFATGFTPPGTLTAGYVGYNAWTTFVVYKSDYGYQDAEKWEVPGLFLPYDALRFSIRPYVTVFYLMGDGAILTAVFPNAVPPRTLKVPNNFAVLKKGLFKGREGCWVSLNDWFVMGNMHDYTFKAGDSKTPHLARKSSR